VEEMKEIKETAINIDLMLPGIGGLHECVTVDVLPMFQHVGERRRMIEQFFVNGTWDEDDVQAEHIVEAK
jgi:hypothetical protein